jgi:hypothetical protein
MVMGRFRETVKTKDVKIVEANGRRRTGGAVKLGKAFVKN